MTTVNLWDYDETPVSDHLTVPEWIEQDITVYDVAAILQGGCDSGAYMPAVTYSDAYRTMGKHGNAVVDYLEDHYDEDIPLRLASDSWDGFCCRVLSMAVETWASSIEEELRDAIEAAEEEESRSLEME